MENELLYHGTTREFHDRQIEKYGKYVGNFGIELHKFYGPSIGYAIDRAKKYNVNPLLLIVDSGKITTLQKGSPFKADFLFPEWYEQLDIMIRNGKVSKETLKMLDDLVGNVPLGTEENTQALKR